jgi:TatD DNase family protein
MLENLVKHPGLIALGETGLDKQFRTGYHSQIALFELHLEFAEKYNKPLIIHAVKAWNDLLIYAKRSKVPFIFHGYSEGIEMTKKLIGLGCYFSLGRSILRISPRVLEAIKIIPLSSLFIETDDSPVTITEMYQEVSKIADISVDDLKIQIDRNFNVLFLTNSLIMPIKG